MRAYLTSKPRIPEARTTDSISADIEDDLAERLKRKLSLRSPSNGAGSNKANSNAPQPDLLEEFRRRLRDR